MIATHNIVLAAIDKLQKDEEGDMFIENALTLPLAEQYRALLESLRFDYMSMRDPNATGSSSGTTDYIHHYKTLAGQNDSPP